MLVLAVLVAATLAGCAGAAETDAARPGAEGTVEPTDLAAAGRRAVEIETEGCGHADPTRGSGMALADDLVLTAAHVVAPGGPIEVSLGGVGRPADLVAYDPQRDLALVRPSASLGAVPPAPTTAALAEGDTAQIIGGATSGDVSATVAEVVIVEMDDVRSPTRSTRRAYLTEAETAPGDSGAGLYDADGRLIGLLFAVSTTDEARSWVTAASEIDDFLADDEPTGVFGCDPDRSKVVRIR